MTFASLQLSSSESWLVWLFWIAVTACFGGAIICIGLLMEKRSGKQPAFTKRAKSLESFGEWVVIAGVVVEIISTGAFAIRGEVEMRQIRAEEAKNEPLNQPIKSMQAYLYLEAVIPKLHDDDQAVSSLCEFDGQLALVATNGQLINTLACNKCDISDVFTSINGGAPEHAKAFSVSFQWPCKNKPWIGIRDQVRDQSISTKDLDAKIAAAVLKIPDLVGHIATGRAHESLVLIINGSIERHFSVPQFTDGAFLISHTNQ